MAPCSRTFVRDISGVVIFLTLLLVTKTFARDNPAGFISIDCGSIASYSDAQTNLLWVEDGDYEVMGKNGYVQDPNSVNSTFDNYQALQSFRYFSEEQMRSKYCYELPLTTTNISFLLRAMFLHGNATELSLPIEFDVHVNATLWKTVKYNEGDDLLDPVVQESIFFAPPNGTTTNVCLVPKQGVPFISSLELRQFDSEGNMYRNSFIARTHQELFFTNIIRWNTGSTNVSSIRYPDDPYDRWWTSPVGNWTEYLKLIKSQETWSTGPEINSVPSKVLEDAWSSETSLYLHVDLPNTEAGTLAYGIFYFALLNESTRNNASTLHLYMDTTEYPSFNITRRPSQRSFFHVLNSNFTGVAIDEPFELNAMEFYQQDSFIAPTTYEDDAYVVNLIKDVLNMKNWQGDPCTPVPYNWIGCEPNYYAGSSWYVIALTLSHLQNSSRLLELNSYHKGWILFDVSITNSGMDASLFQSLLHDFLNSTLLKSVNMSFNDIDTFPDGEWWVSASNGSDYQLSTLDFSYNQLSEIPDFAHIPFSKTIQTLNISSNKITGEFPNITYFSNLTSLQVLNLSNNSIHGRIPRSLSFYNLPSLQVLDISGNRFSGDFPSDFNFIDEDGPLQWLKADNNEFTGVLNLTTWYQNLLAVSGTSEIHATLNSTESSTGFNHSYSFLNNKISSIEPSAEDFQPLIEGLINTGVLDQSGILLGGNPYCKHAKHFTHKYLCRSSLTDIVNEDVKEKSKKGIILGSVLGGGSLLLCFVFFTLAIWRLSRKIYILKMVEQELAIRSVQPPFFSYHDLKLATKNFHKDNQLGKGSYGAVYKGVLSDGTIIAVKRLFNSTQKQVLNDFLNEVVLITGIKHKNLIQLKGCCIENQERILVYEYAEIGNVEDALWGENGETILSWTSRFKICMGVASGLTYLHEELQPKIIHRDIKPGNVLLDKNLNPKIADFGLAKHFVEEIDVHVTQVISGTRGYFAPEYIAEGRITTKIDVYSFGILALEIVSGRKCFDLSLPPEEIQLKSWAENLQRSGSMLNLVDPVIRMDYSAPEVLKVIKIALMCVQHDPELRPTMSQVEIMLLEGQDSMYQMLRRAAFKKGGENKTSLDKIYKNFGDAMGSDTFSTLFGGRGSQESGIGSSTAGLENYPLLYSPYKESGSEASQESTSSGTRKEYFRTLRSMNRSLSERIRRGSSDYL